MNIREALRCMSPSLALQRAASDEIARLDAQLAEANKPGALPPYLQEAAYIIERAAKAVQPKTSEHTDLDEGFECNEASEAETVAKLLTHGSM